MSPLVLEILNAYTEQKCTISEAFIFISELEVLPLPEELCLDDWRSHVPMPFLEEWHALSDDERVCIYVMALSGTHPYESSLPDFPGQN
jgi:hypothetical protein